MPAPNKPHTGDVTAAAIVEETAADQVALEPERMEVPPGAGVNQYVTAWFKRVRSGQSGVLPVVGGLIVIIIIFQIERSRFLSALNLVNLLQQSAAFIVLGMAEIFVLLLGEIDLSLGYSGAVGAAVMTILAYPPINLGWVPAILAGLATTSAIGFAQGQIISRLRLSSVRRHARRPAVLGGLPDLADQQTRVRPTAARSGSTTPRSTTSSTAM